MADTSSPESVSSPARGDLAVPPWTDPQAIPYVRIDGVTRKFGDFVAVDNVSLKIFKGELFCLLGGSGCGKTTLLRLLAGFESPSQGKIFIDGVDMQGIPPYERPVNMMFQSYALFPHMTAEENIAFGLKQDRMPKPQIARRVGEMLDLVKLSQYGKRKPHQLSGGQRQRVALARALARQPKLLLLDEPLGALDKKLREHTQFELVNIQEQLGVTFVVVTHDQEEAMTLSSRIGVMDAGRIVQVGTPNDIYEYPTCRFVTEFIGSVNMFEGRLIEDEPDHIRIRCDELPVPVYVDHGVSSPPGAVVWAAVRPEKMAMSRVQPDVTDNYARGRVKDVAYMGDTSVYLVQLDSGKIVRVTQANMWRHATDRIVANETVFVHWHPGSPVVVLE